MVKVFFFIFGEEKEMRSRRRKEVQQTFNPSVAFAFRIVRIERTTAATSTLLDENIISRKKRIIVNQAIKPQNNLFSEVTKADQSNSNEHNVKRKSYT